MQLAATPTWLADNLAPVAILTLLVLTVVVLRLVQQTVVRVVLLALIAAVSVFTYVNRAPLGTCARTCECQIADRNIEVALCSPDDDL